MANIKLVFHGHRWPAAKVGERYDAFQWADTADTFGTRITIAEISTTGGGRDWMTDCAMGFWRTFAEMDHESDEAVVDFVRRYGDPDGALTASTPIRTRYWLTLRTHLQAIARAWAPPAEHGVSRLSGDAECIQLAKAHAKRIEKPFMEKGARADFDSDLGFAIEFRTLGDFMIASAIDMLHRQAPMRRCDNCGHWYEIKRSTSKTCSATCRNALLKKGKGKDDGVSQEG